MRVVADTNVVVSGLLWQGPPRRIVDAARAGLLVLVSSEPLVAAQLSAAMLADLYAEFAELVAPASIAPTILDDPDDDAVLATALAGGADLIVSGDVHLLALSRYQGIRIVDAATFASVIAIRES